MMRKLLTLVFVLAVACNAFAGVSSRMYGDDNCSASCCQVALQKEPGRELGSRCCVMDCETPGGTHAPSPVTSIVEKRHKEISLSHSSLKPYTFLSRKPVKPLLSSSRYLYSSSNLYLDTGALLI